jgi:hypothetical protein
MVAVLLGAVCSKVYGVARAVFASPLDTVRAIPDNWYKSVLCTDVVTPLEIVPAYEAWLEASTKPEDKKQNDQVTEYLLSKRLGIFLTKTGDQFLVYLFSALATGTGTVLVSLLIFGDWLAGTVLLPVACVILLLFLPFTPLHLLVYAPALFYRFALKVTALTYFPLLLNRYIAASPVPIEQQYKELRNNKKTTVALRVAWVVVVGVLLKIIAFSLGIRITDISNQFVHNASLHLASIPFFGRLIDPLSIRTFFTIQFSSYSIPLWQLASAVSAVLTLAFHYFGVEYFYWRMERNDPVNHLLMRRLLNAILTTGGFISTYAILANIWIVTHRTPLIVLPRVGPVWP